MAVRGLFGDGSEDGFGAMGFTHGPTAVFGLWNIPNRYPFALATLWAGCPRFAALWLLCYGEGFARAGVFQRRPAANGEGVRGRSRQRAGRHPAERPACGARLGGRREAGGGVVGKVGGRKAVRPLDRDV